MKLTEIQQQGADFTQADDAAADLKVRGQGTDRR